MKKVLSFSLLAVSTILFVSACTTVENEPAHHTAPVTTTTTESHSIRAY